MYEYKELDRAQITKPKSNDGIVLTVKDTVNILLYILVINQV